MKILILRTFAHSLVWENTRNHCEFEKSQMDNMIYEWEPDYANLEISDFSYALGIYTLEYFNYIPRYPNAKPVFQNTKNEKIISILKPMPFENTSKFINLLKDCTIQVFYEYIKKLWKEPDELLMNKIDNLFITEKMNELKTKYVTVPATRYHWPLSFSLEANVVEKVLGKMNIKVE